MSAVIRLLFGGRVTDSQSGFRIIDAALLAAWRLRSTEYEIETEMLCKALKSGARIKEVPSRARRVWRPDRFSTGAQRAAHSRHYFSRATHPLICGYNNRP
jgi:hypothetical protein